MLKTVQAVPRFLLEPLRRGLQWAFGAGDNPLHWLGALTIFFFWVVLVSGIYVFVLFETSIFGAYHSVEYMTREQWYLGGVMRSLHRYASDAAIITLALHMLTEFASGRYRGARWFSWFTGVPLLWMVFPLGITGYWLVWDQLAQYIALATSELLDVLPIFTDPMARNFLTPDSLSDRFFTLLAFLHLVGIPIFLVFGIWFHLLRLTHPRVNPPLRLALGSKGKGLSGFYVLRHLGATEFGSRPGCSLSDIRRWLGHAASSSMADVYMRPVAPEHRDVVEWVRARLLGNKPLV